MSEISEDKLDRSGLLHPLIWLVLAMVGFWFWGLKTSDEAAPVTVSFDRPSGLLVNSVELKVLDMPAGAVGVFDADTNQPLATFESGEGSFLRGVFRSLARERRLRSVDGPPTFTLHSLDDGGLVIEDSTTGRWVLLEAFGQVNAEVFSEILNRAIDTRSSLLFGAGVSE